MDIQLPKYSSYTPVEIELPDFESPDDAARAYYSYEDNPYTEMVDEATAEQEQSDPDAKPRRYGLSDRELQMLTFTRRREQQEERQQKQEERQQKQEERQQKQASTRRRIAGKEKGAWTDMMRQAYRDAGVTNEDMVNILVAQDALESGWGKSTVGDYNYGNITTGSQWKGAYKAYYNKEYGKEYKFRSYDTPSDYAKDKLSLLRRLYQVDTGSDDVDTFLKRIGGYNRGGYRYIEDNKNLNVIKDIYKQLS